MLEHEPLFIPSLPLHIIFRIRFMYWHSGKLGSCSSGTVIEIP